MPCPIRDMNTPSMKMPMDDCLPASCDEPTPRMLMVATRLSPLLLMTMPGAYCWRSMKVVRAAFLISDPDSAVIEIGTS